jgi:hypothetical protein
MTYDLYFHNDFDGRAAAAVMLSFLRERGDDVEHFAPIDYYLIEDYLKEDFFAKHKLFKGKRNPAIVVDFAFNPGAAWWFDHHEGSATRKKWKKKFRPTKQWHFNPGYASCCGQVAAVLEKQFGWKPKPHFKELIKWSDIIDGAKYISPRQTMDLKDPALQIAVFFDCHGNEVGTNGPFIELLSRVPLADIARRRDVKRTVREAKKEIVSAIAYIEKNIEITGLTGYIYFSSWRLAKPRHAPYALYPKLIYLVRCYRKDGFYHLGAGQNPWKRKENHINIGALIKKYGGGGHFGVGATEIKTKQAAERAAKEIVEYLNSH